MKSNLQKRDHIYIQLEINIHGQCQYCNQFIFICVIDGAEGLDISLSVFETALSRNVSITEEAFPAVEQSFHFVNVHKISADLELEHVILNILMRAH